MRASRIITSTSLLAMAGCKGCFGTIDLGQGPETDARFTADVYTWECYDKDSGDTYEGVFSFNMALEYAPDGLQGRQLPGGCVYGLSMFPIDAGDNGADIPELTDDPKWSTEDMAGELRREGPGFYYHEVFSNVHTCSEADSILYDGVTLDEAGILSGVGTPPAGRISWVETDFTDEDGNGELSFGETVDLSWESEDWDEAWIQIRKEREGESYGTVTCNVTGEDGFRVDDDVWNLFQGNVNVETINLYVGFQRTEIVELDDGQKVEAVTRGMHVLVVQD